MEKKQQLAVNKKQRLLEYKRKHCVVAAVLSLFVRDVIVTVEFNIHPDLVSL